MMVCMEQLYIATPQLRNANSSCKPNDDLTLAAPLLRHRVPSRPNPTVLVGTSIESTSSQNITPAKLSRPSIQRLGRDVHFKRRDLGKARD